MVVAQDAQPTVMIVEELENAMIITPLARKESGCGGERQRRGLR